jgi:hypothetical protein
MRYEDNERWQFQPLRVKIYRWLRFVFPAWFVLIYKLSVWLLQGAPRHDLSETNDEWVMTRWETICLFKNCTIGIAECNAGHWFTMDELLADLEENDGLP